MSITGHPNHDYASLLNTKPLVTRTSSHTRRYHMYPKHPFRTALGIQYIRALNGIRETANPYPSFYDHLFQFCHTSHGKATFTLALLHTQRTFLKLFLTFSESLHLHIHNPRPTPTHLSHTRALFGSILTLHTSCSFRGSTLHLCYYYLNEISHTIGNIVHHD